ncbi:MAG: PAS domain S-box protein [Williamsia sp.]|nr:PAS domain S-box protein [Williamsia sp.]
MKPLDFGNQAVRKLLESITDGFYFLDLNWIVLYFNKQAEQILNIRREDIIGRNIWTCFPEEYGKEFYKKFKHSLESQQSSYFEEYLPRLGIWGELTVYPSETGISVHFRDITKRKENESLLRQMNHNYRMILKATSGAIWEYQLGKDTCYWHNEHFKDLFGYNIVNAPVLHTFWESLIHPDDRQEKLRRVAAQLEYGYEMDRSEYRFKKADGTYAYVLERTFLEKNESGEAIKLVGCTEDITVMKRAGQELQKSELNHRLLFQKSSLAEIICGEDTLQILKVNDAALEMYGYTQEEFLALDVHDLRPPSERESLKERVKEAKTLNSTFRYMANHVKKNGEPLLVEISAACMEYDGFQCFLIALSDHTHRRHLERQIEDLRLISQKNIAKAAIEAQEKQKEEIAIELHDNINQVLATTKMSLCCIKPSDQNQRSLLEHSKTSILYCIDEIRRLTKSFTPPSLGKSSLEAAVHSLIQSIPFIRGEQVDVAITNLQEEKLDEGFKVTVYRIIQEQLTNILKHAEASTIVIRLSQSQYCLSVLIEDDGKGFDVNAKRYGIGLNNIKNRADLYNGLLNIQSSPRRGCTLTVEFILEGR